MVVKDMIKRLSLLIALLLIVSLLLPPSTVEASPVYENFTTYTEVDPNNHINLTGINHIDFVAWQNEDAYLYKDKGVDYFGSNWEHTIDIKVLSASGYWAYGQLWAMSNDLDDTYGWKDTGETALCLQVTYETAPNPELFIMEIYGGSIYESVWTNLTYNTSYYLTINKTGTAFTLEIYSNSNRTTLLATKNRTLHADHSFRYIFAANTWNTGGNRWVNMEIENLDLQEIVTTPSITTNNATYVKRTTARLNSYLVDDGNEDCDVRFQYGNSTGNYTTNTSWINDTYVTGNYPYLDATSLTLNTTYYFRVQTRNSNSTVNGSELNFTTYAFDISEPTNFIAYPNSTSISLTWVKGIGATYTMIRGQAGAYPANYTDGKQVYNGTMSTALDTGLTLGTTYYYRAWSYDSISYSTNYTDILMTTTAYTEVTQDTPSAPATPSTWWGTPDYTGLSNLAGYGIVNTIADNLEIPRNTFWMSLIILGIMCIGLFIYSVQHNATVAVMLTSVLIIGAAIAGLLPMFMLIIIGIPIVGIFLVKRRV